MATCVLCGKNTDVTIRYLCLDCYTKEYDPIKIKADHVKICPTCGRVFTQRWEEFQLSRIASWIEKRVKVSPDIEKAMISVSLREGEKEFDVDIILNGIYEGIPVQLKKSFRLPIVYEQCPHCARRAGGYYEAVIQIRGKRWAEVYKRVIRILSNEKEPKAFVVKEERVKNGIDIYVGSKKAVSKIGRKMKDNVDEVKTSYSLVTERDGKPITRLFLLLRLD